MIMANPFVLGCKRSLEDRLYLSKGNYTSERNATHLSKILRLMDL